MLIRKAKKNDLEGIYAIFLELAKSEDESSKKVDPFIRRMRKRKKAFESNIKKDLLSAIRKRSNTLYLVAEDSEKNNKIIAYAYATIPNIHENLFDIPKIGYLSALVVSKNYRGQKISSRLNKEVESWFKKNKCRHINLEVFSSNPAKKIYEKWGYKNTVTRMWKKL